MEMNSSSAQKVPMVLQFQSRQIDRNKESTVTPDSSPRTGSKHEHKIEFIEVVQNGAGSSFGELALIHRRPRAASIKAKTDCTFAIINKATYQKILLK